MPDVFLTKEELAFRDEFRDFVAREIEPMGLSEKMENDEIDFPVDMVRKLGKAGYFGMCLSPHKKGRQKASSLCTVHSF